ncbi:MAG: UDP-N-acetylmuramoyl-L-alanine--D-glutamate ligase, partial [Acidimicrobiia bacterium]
MRLLVLGGAVSGLAAARLARRLGHSVTVYDRRPGAGAELLGEGIGVVEGAWAAELLDGMDLVVTSPGFPERSLPVVEALEAGVPLWSEVEFAWRHLDVPVAAVTGTNGKTTVTELASRMLTRSGRRAAAAGNIGSPLSQFVDGDREVLVVEVSSFQLSFTEAFHPRAAALLNLAPDHLDWHGSMASYRASKQRVYLNQTPDEPLVFDADDPGAVEAVARAPSRLVPVSGRRLPDGGAGVADRMLRAGPASIGLARLATSDPSHLVDLAAAAELAQALGAHPEAVEEEWHSFRPGPHRRTLVGEWGGIR